MARGEVLQLLRSYSTATSREEYLEVIRGKTSSIIAASCKAAAFLAGFEGTEVEHFKDFGHNLGMSFQIVDDILDYTAEKGVFGKAIGKDFFEGKVTLPLIVLMEQLETEDRRRVSDFFLKDSPEDGDFKTILHLMDKHGTLARTMEMAARYRDTALESLAQVQTGPCHESLESLTQYVLERCS